MAGLASGSVSAQADVAGYRALVGQDLRLATIGYKLVSASAPFCQTLERNPGWVLHDEMQYPDPDAARTALNFRQPVAVAAVVAGGPADQAGVKAGDGLSGLNGRYWAWQKQTRQRKNSLRIELVQSDISEALASDQAVEIILETDSGRKLIRLNPTPACSSRFWVDTRSKLDAGADGENVRVTEGLMEFAKDDDELAAAVAHELSHNLLNHRKQLASSGRSTANILATEIEADQLSIWLLANAGYDLDAALRFTERFGRKTGLGIFSDGTHLRWQNRIKVMKAEIEAINVSTKVDNLLPPPLLKGKKTDTQ